MSIDSDVWINIFLYYCRSLICFYLSVFVVVICFAFIFKAKSYIPTKVILTRSLTFATTLYLIFFALTVKWTLIRLSLDAENTQTQEYVYNTLFQVDLDKAIRLAINKNEDQNIRFYASCRIAEILRGSSDALICNTLQRVDNAPPVRPYFLGNNSLNSGLYVPDKTNGPYLVKDLVKHRLEVLKYNTDAVPRK